MKKSKDLAAILDLCIRIDATAAAIYTNLADSANTPALGNFWKNLADEGRAHLEYWEKLKTLSKKQELPEAFEDPKLVREELEDRARQVQALLEQWQADQTIANAFVIAYRLESYKLHPALRTLFHSFRPLTDGTPAGEKEIEETNIDAFKEALHEHGEETPELELVGETLQHLQEQNKILAQQTMLDTLSGLLNRRGFFFMAKQLAHLSKRSQAPVTVLAIEIDNFKEVNELHGRQKGDALLKAIADILQSMLRQSDLLARYGGDEFIALLPDTAAEGGLAVGEKLRAALEKARPAGIRATVSVGVAEAVMKEDIEQELDMLIRYAEGNLVIAKTNGKNQVVS
ncbi:MAG: diguanylate cyclase [Chloroflexota bacterium]